MGVYAQKIDRKSTPSSSVSDKTPTAAGWSPAAVAFNKVRWQELLLAALCLKQYLSGGNGLQHEIDTLMVLRILADHKISV